MLLSYLDKIDSMQHLFPLSSICFQRNKIFPENHSKTKFSIFFSLGFCPWKTFPLFGLHEKIGGKSANDRQQWQGGS